MEFTKEHEGKIIYARPTGNAARRWDGNLKEFEVVKVKRKYVEMRINGGVFTDNYCPKTGATQSAINAGYTTNSGYLFFESKDDYRKWEFRETVCENITKMTRDYSLRHKLSGLSDEDLRVLEHILLKVCD